VERSARPGVLGPVMLVLARLGVVAVLVGIWQLGSSEGWWDPQTFGKPSGALSALGDYLGSPRAATSLRATGTAVLISFLVGSASGTLAGLALGMSRRADTLLAPFLPAVNSLPRIALAPLFIVWFGLGTTSKVALAVSYVFFVLAENARSAVQSVDDDLRRMAQMNALGRIGTVTKVILPSAVPTMFGGLRLAFAYSLLGVIGSEMIAAPSGVGQDLLYFSSSYQINAVFGILAAIVALAVAVNFLISALQRWALRWQRV